MNIIKDINTLVDLVGSDAIIEANIKSLTLTPKFHTIEVDNWISGRIVGIDLDDNQVKFKHEDDSSRWVSFSFQLNKQNPIFYNIRLVKWKTLR